MLVSVGILLFAAACSRAPSGATDPRPAHSASADRAVYKSEARRALGDGSEVILFGDLAHNGHIQLFIVNRLPRTQSQPPGTLVVSRAAILEKEDDSWHEIFLADDHLKNEQGFLAGEPLDSVGAWRLRYVQGRGALTMYFTPLQQSAQTGPATIEVRWNPQTSRYQAFDRQSGRFLAADPNPGGTPSFVIKR